MILAVFEILQKVQVKRKRGFLTIFGVFSGFTRIPRDFRGFWEFPGTLEDFLGILEDPRISRGFQGVLENSYGFVASLRSFTVEP